MRYTGGGNRHHPYARFRAAQQHSYRAGGDHLQIVIPALCVAVVVAREDLLDALEAAFLNAGRVLAGIDDRGERDAAIRWLAAKLSQFGGFVACHRIAELPPAVAERHFGASYSSRPRAIQIIKILYNRNE